MQNADTWHTAPLPEKMEMGKQVRLIATHVLLQHFFDVLMIGGVEVFDQRRNHPAVVGADAQHTSIRCSTSGGTTQRWLAPTRSTRRLGSRTFLFVQLSF